MTIKRLAVFCGCGVGPTPAFAKAAKQLANLFIMCNISLVYGGSNLGLMKILSDTIMQQGGEVIGVIPQFLVDKEFADTSVTKLHIVNSMHERKALIAELSDGFITLPGGIGTMDEFFEMFTWAKLGLHHKPCGILNTENYYDDLLKLLDKMVGTNFLRQKHRDLVLAEKSPEKLLTAFGIPLPTTACTPTT